MRKNSIRKFVHAVLDLIPLFIIPIFAIYTRNENYNSNIEIEVQENLKVENFNQNINVEHTTYNSTYTTWTYDATTNTYNVNNTTAVLPWASGIRLQNIQMINNHKYISLFESTTTYNLYCEIQGRYQYSLSSNQYWVIFTFSPNGSTAGIVGTMNQTAQYEIKNLMLIDLTAIFGIGNEPSNYSEYYNIFGNEYYNYALNETIYVEGVNVVYNDTDVGSQFVYTLYNATDKYFNMNNVFNMNDVYDWFVLNIFGGNAPLGLYIVWNIVLYEFVMDLLMLLYGVFMFFIDCCTKLIEKPLNAIK